MDSIGIRFLLSNLAIAILISAMLLIKKLFKNHMSARGHYHIWFLFLGMLTLPFIPLKTSSFQVFSWLNELGKEASTHVNTAVQSGAGTGAQSLFSGIPDYSLSVSQTGISILNIVLFGIWITGICAMLLFTIRSNLRLRRLIHSSLPVQNEAVRSIFQECKSEVKIKGDIPLYSSAFLKSPISAGLFKPCILLPIHLISDFKEKDLRFILLHELQHYKHKDLSVNLFICISRIVYWFHPLVWYALKQMKDDREIACDAAVLQMLDEDSYAEYGHTLLSFAQKLNNPQYATSAGIAGSKKQITQRIMGILSYHKESRWMKAKSILVLFIISTLILGSAPFLSVGAKIQDSYDFVHPNVSYLNLSDYFMGYKGSFTLYNPSDDSWQIYNPEDSRTRISPDSTYKLYNSLFALETGIISSKDSSMAWNKMTYPFDAWNQDQNLDSAMKNSVNWYFQNLDQKMGLPVIEKYISQINYGNQDLSGGLSEYWVESSLKISPVEQVELLKKLYYNEFGFSEESIETVKNSMLISKNDEFTLYGKTGTGSIEDKDCNGWFIGFIERDGSASFFATNIQGEDGASGRLASKISQEVLNISL